ncbi:unnamed protein product [Rhizophagus irregularis]|nr:unnamed protein product [Rhizophagus irregularis]
MTKRKKRRRNEKRCLKEDLVKRRPRQREDRPKKKTKKIRKKHHTHKTHTPNHIPKIPKGRRKKKGLRDRRPNKEKPRQREDGPRKRRR